MKTYLFVGLIILSLFLVSGCAKEVEVAETTNLIPPPAPEVEEPTSVPSTATEAPENTFINADTVEFWGAQGFSEQKMSIRVGESITFVNKNPSSVDSSKEEVIVFQDEDRKSVNSPQISYGEEYTRTFTESGTYKFWSVGYGIMGEVVVE